MILITYATESKGYFLFLKLSCKRFNIKLIVLGLGEVWTDYNCKINSLKKYIIKNKLYEDIICFVDAYDVILLRDLDELEKIYLQDEINNKILIGVENPEYKNINYITKEIFNYDKSFINTGVYISRGKNILNMFKNMIKHVDDQYRITNYYNLNPDLFYIDKESKYILNYCNCLSQGSSKDIKISNNTLIYKDKYMPFFLHANGNTFIDNYLKDIGYNIKNRDIENIKKEYYLSFYKKIIHYTMILKLYIVITILFINFSFIIFYNMTKILIVNSKTFSLKL